MEFRDHEFQEESHIDVNMCKEYKYGCKTHEEKKIQQTLSVSFKSCVGDWESVKSETHLSHFPS